jgi:hypothetical protein
MDLGLSTEIFTANSLLSPWAFRSAWIHCHTQLQDCDPKTPFFVNLYLHHEREKSSAGRAGMCWYGAACCMDVTAASLGHGTCECCRECPVGGGLHAVALPHQHEPVPDHNHFIQLDGLGQEGLKGLEPSPVGGSSAKWKDVWFWGRFGDTCKGYASQAGIFVNSLMASPDPLPC